MNKMAGLSSLRACCLVFGCFISPCLPAMTNDSGGGFAKNRHGQNAAQPQANTNLALLPIPLPSQRVSQTVQALPPIFPLLSVLPLLDWPQLVDNSLQEFLRRLLRWRPRTVDGKIDTSRRRLAWIRDVREGRVNAGSLTTVEVREDYQGPFFPDQFCTDQQGVYFNTGMNWIRVEGDTLCDSDDGLIYRRILRQRPKQIAFRIAAPHLCLKDSGGQFEDTTQYADLVASISAADRSEFATNVLRLLKDSNKPLRGITVEAATKVARRILMAERLQSEAALAFAYTEVYKLKYHGYRSATDVFGRDGSYIPARLGDEERSGNYTLEQLRTSFDSISRLKAQKDRIRNEDSVVKKLRKLVAIFGYDTSQEMINRPLFGEYFPEASVSERIPQLPGHRVVSVSGEGNACLLRSVLIGVFPDQRGRIATLSSREIRNQVRQAIGARLADPETVRLLSQDHRDYLDLFGRQSLPDSMTQESYLNHFVNRETFEGREMIALLAHVYQRRIYVHNQDRYLEEQFGDSRHEPLHLHFTAYLGTEPFPNHYDAYVPVRFISELQTPTEQIPPGMTASTDPSFDFMNTEALIARALEIVNLLEANFESGQEPNGELFVELENILRSPLICDPLQRFIRQKLQKMLGQSLHRGYRNWDDDSRPPPGAGGAGTSSTRSFRHRSGLSSATTSSGTWQASSQVSTGKQQRIDASISLSIPSRTRPFLPAASH
ncbi:MAG: hypothetical protein I8H75_04645 [Myxococcaceae bacterium]|nr:hypothetical protein [Myxococcaceae bacterium]MBH2006612.1 hypothetical protein [Myxococcaceae bacterium]